MNNIILIYIQSGTGFASWRYRNSKLKVFHEDEDVLG